MASQPLPSPMSSTLLNQVRLVPSAVLAALLLGLIVSSSSSNDRYPTTSTFSRYHRPSIFVPSTRRPHEPQQPSPSFSHQDANDFDQAPTATSSCFTMNVYLQQEDLDANQFFENNRIPAPGVRFGGSIPMTAAREASADGQAGEQADEQDETDPVDASDMTTTTTAAGKYNYLLTFLSADDCLAVGSYTLFHATTTSNNDDVGRDGTSPPHRHKPTDPAPVPDQVTFTASCHALPYFTVTGGTGQFAGATGRVRYQIPLADRSGYRHELRLCVPRAGLADTAASSMA